MSRPTTERSVVTIEHKQMRVILNPKAEIPKDVEWEQGTIDWASALYLSAMRMAAAGVLVEEDSLEKAASLLWWAGFEVPTGYFSADEEDALPGRGSEEALRAWVARDEKNIRAAFQSIGFYLAGTASLMASKEDYDWRREHDMMD